jgi:GntR family transcriptional regulator/MocR family aminotransferase
MRGEYARRREVVVGALDGLRLRGDTAGLHLVVDLPHVAAERVARDAADRGVLVDPLERHHAGPRTFGGLVVGYGSAASTGGLRAGCAIVRDLAAGT